MAVSDRPRYPTGHGTARPGAIRGRPRAGPAGPGPYQAAVHTLAWVPFCTQARASSPVPSATPGEKANSTRGFERVRELVGVACSQVVPSSADVSIQPV